MKLRLKFWQHPDPDYRAALKFTRQFGYRGRRLPPFVSGETATSCPVARAIRMSQRGELVSVGCTVCTIGKTDHPLPDPVSNFLGRADTGDFPELGRPWWDYGFIFRADILSETGRPWWDH